MRARPEHVRRRFVGVVRGDSGMATPNHRTGPRAEGPCVQCIAGNAQAMARVRNEGEPRARAVVVAVIIGGYHRPSYSFHPVSGTRPIDDELADDCVMADAIDAWSEVPWGRETAGGVGRWLDTPYAQGLNRKGQGLADVEALLRRGDAAQFPPLGGES